MSDTIITQDFIIEPKTVSVETMKKTPVFLYLMDVKQSSLPAVKSSLNRMARLLTNDQYDCFGLQWEKMRYQEALLLRYLMGKSDFHINTRNFDLCVFRGLIKTAWSMGLIPTDEYLRTVSIKGFKGSFEPTGIALTKTEIKKLLSACVKDKTPAGRRDAAMVVFLYIGGLRREELTKVKLHEYDAETGRILVHGKETKDRIVFVANNGIQVVKDWLTQRGNEGEYLFVPISKSGTINFRIAKPLSTKSVLNMCIKRGKQAGVRHFTPHDLRRTCISDMLANEIDIATVSAVAGHDDPKTTLRYDKRKDDRKQQAAETLQINYDRKDLLERGLVK